MPDNPAVRIFTYDCLGNLISDDLWDIALNMNIHSYIEGGRNEYAYVSKDPTHARPSSEIVSAKYNTLLKLRNSTLQIINIPRGTYKAEIFDVKGRLLGTHLLRRSETAILIRRKASGAVVVRLKDADGKVIWHGQAVAVVN